MHDETARRQAEHDLEVSEIRYRRLFESAKDGILILDADSGKIVDVNPFVLDLLGFSREHFLGKMLWEIGPFSDIAPSEAAFHERGYVRYDHLPLQAKDGGRVEVEFVSNLYAVNSTRVIQCNIRDIAERKRAEQLLQARLGLWEFAATHSLAELLQRTLDLLEEHTGSSIGFYHFVDSDQEQLTLQAWSTRTVKEFCKATGQGLHYPIADAGVWTDAAILRRLVIHNDYASLTHKKGLPDGHAAVLEPTHGARGEHLAEEQDRQPSGAFLHQLPEARLQIGRIEGLHAAELLCVLGRFLLYYVDDIVVRGNGFSTLFDSVGWTNVFANPAIDTFC